MKEIRDMEVKVAPADLDLSDATLVVGVLEGLQPAPGSEADFAHADPVLMEAAGFEGKAKQTLAVPHPEAKTMLLVGLGSEVDFESVRAAAGNAVRAARTERVVTRLAAIGIDGASRAVTEGSLLGGYEFRTYKTNGPKVKVTFVEVPDADEAELEAAARVSRSVIQARDWVNTPAVDLSPSQLAEQMSAVLGDAGIEVEVWDEDRIAEEKLGALLGVAAGSARPPRLVKATYRPEGAKKHVALVGKGITFDSGGLSIKSANFMEDMKVDMSGAAIVVAAAEAIASLGIPVAVTVVAPLTDNAVGGNATRPGDVLRPVKGPTIEVLNTDAEGRLILADGLGVASMEDPDLMIDVATLTGAMHVALGDRVAGYFASDPEAGELIRTASSRAGEPFWEMPLVHEYRKSLDSNVADIKNVSGGRYGGAITAALFLHEYADGRPWVHMDIAGPAFSKETYGDVVKGGTGVGVRTLVEVARTLAGE
ncbi:MAG: leucyl aminopeptidase [Actinomycetes bacterium]